jgi:ribosomal protein S18 acetylase RimI-like enzyme
MIRPASVDDAALLAEIFDISSDGMPRKVWAALAGTGQSIWEVAEARVKRDVGDFSYRRAWVLVDKSCIVGGFFGGVLPDKPAELAPEDDPALGPFQELQNIACGSWHLDALAVLPDHRRIGFGTKLIAEAISIARRSGCTELTLILMSNNQSAAALYAQTGLTERARRRFDANGWPGTGSDAILLSMKL